jgi:hypothetical protein
MSIVRADTCALSVGKQSNGESRVKPFRCAVFLFLLYQVGLAAQTLSLTSPQVLLDGTFQVVMQGLTSNQNYNVEISTNLFVWADLSPFTAPDSSLVYHDTNTTNSLQRFYRARWIIPSLPLTLQSGSRYFNFQGSPSFLYGRNPTGWEVSQFTNLMAWERASGGKIVRIDVNAGMPPSTNVPAGTLDENWATNWEAVWDLAASNGLYILVTFTDWDAWSTNGQWQDNPYNAALGGPAQQPIELFENTKCQQLWLGWVSNVVQRWQYRTNIFAWEILSEMDNVTGATQSNGVQFAQAAAATIRAADSYKRPVTASLACNDVWPTLYATNTLDILCVHPYANLGPLYNSNLDEQVLTMVRSLLTNYPGKPILIGESGLDASGDTGIDSSSNAPVGIRNALWAEIVSGAMNGRMLWYEDGFDQYTGVDLRTEYAYADAPMASFVAGVNFTNFVPILVKTNSSGIEGAAIGNNQMILGWFRDILCAAPNWPVQPVAAGQSVTLVVPGDATEWNVVFYQSTNSAIISTNQFLQQGSNVTVTLPAFQESIAFKMFIPL